VNWGGKSACLTFFFPKHSRRLYLNDILLATMAKMAFRMSKLDQAIWKVKDCNKK